MFTIRCTECGAAEGDGVVVLREDQENRETNPERTISEDIQTTFYCECCNVEETIQTGVLPETNAAHFESARGDADEKMSVVVDGETISFRGVDEQVSENTYYTSQGVRGTSKVHHVHIHARDPPSFSKGKHQVRIGEHIKSEMILGSIRYHDDNNRTLKFFRSLDGEVMEPIDKETAEAKEWQAERN